MADNDSVVSGASSARTINERVIIIQVFIAVFLCINFLLIKTFFSKSFFYTTMRYILFAVTLLSDTLILIISDILLILSFFQSMQVWLCIIIYIVLSLYSFVTPVTLTAMTLERYVAICMPLRHGELSSRRNTLHCILIIHGISSLPVILVLSSFFASAPLSFYKHNKVCSLEIFLLHKWHNDLFAGVKQFYFLMMFVSIVFSYIKIMKVAMAVSGENKKSTWKGVRTVILHGFQLLLCLIQFWCPFIETAVLQINFMLFINVRYFNYITFYLAPKCLNPMIYGLRDERFSNALKSSLKPL